MKIDFEVTNGTYTLRDAIHLPDDHTYSDAEIEAMKQARFDKWVQIITTVPEEEPVEEVVQEAVQEEAAE